MINENDRDERKKRCVLMRRGYMLLVLIMCGLVLGGCLNMGNPADKTQGENKNTKDNENDKQNAYEQENYIPIQEYTGEGFTLRDANPKTGEIAEANREEVVTAVEDFFKSKYKTEVDEIGRASCRERVKHRGGDD